MLSLHSFILQFDCPVSLLAEEMRSNKWKYWGDKNPLKKDNKIPDSGDNGEENEEPVIEKIVGGTVVDPPRKYKVSCTIVGIYLHLA